MSIVNRLRERVEALEDWRRDVELREVFMSAETANERQARNDRLRVFGMVVAFLAVTLQLATFMVVVIGGHT